MGGLSAFLRTVGIGRLIVLIAALGLVFALLIMLMGNVNRPGMALLYGNLNEQEMGEIAAQLDNQNIPYEFKQDGSVYVPSNRVGELRLSMAGSGIVGSSTEGYAIFDQQRTFGTTSLVQNINARRALEGELAKTIESIPAIQGARVHIVMAERKAFTRQSVDPTAAVALTLGARVLTPEQVTSIAELVAAAVPELQAKHVTITDQRGNLLTSGGDSHAATFQERIKREVENNYAQAVSGMIERVVGPGKVSVSVAANLNFDQFQETSEQYDPEGAVPRSEQAIEETRAGSSGGGTVGIEGNLPGGQQGASGGSNNESRTEETVNYEISKKVSTLVREGGDLQKLSVAVLVEGGQRAEDGTYTPMSEQRRDQLTQLVRAAIGYNAERGDTIEITDLPFNQAEEADAPKPPLMSKEDMFRIGNILALLLGLLIVFFVVIKPTLAAIQRAIAEAEGKPIAAPAAKAGAAAAPTAGGAPAPQAGAAPAAPKPAAKREDATVDLSHVEGRVRESAVKQVTQMVDAYPEESLGVVRSWMSEMPRDE